MAQEPCIPCEEHEVLHRGNWGFGPANDPCPQCEEHAELHARGWIGPPHPKPTKSWSWW